MGKLSNEQERLVLDNMKLVYNVVKKMGIMQNSIDYEDIISIGTIGLIKSAITFNSLKGYAFSTYATKCIKNEIFFSFRKTKKCVKEISFYEKILSNDEGKILTLENILEDSDSEFDEKIVIKENFIKLVSIILNYLKRLNRVVMLYRIASLSGPDIANIVHCTRSNISRIELRSTEIIREVFEHQKYYEEQFFMEIKGDEYIISFSYEDIDKFDKIFTNILSDIIDDKNLPYYKVNDNNKRIMIHVLAHPDSFFFIGRIIQEIDNTIKVKKNKNKNT